MSPALERRLEDLRTRVASLPEATEPPLTMLQVIDRSQRERDWQRLFFYYLSPDEPHGLDGALLERVLTALSERSDLDFTFSTVDLADVRVEQEVDTAAGRPDAVVWAPDRWFVCWELKVGASESGRQTEAYVDVDEFRGIDLSKDDVPRDGHTYVYLAPADASPPAADQFVPISWGWLTEELQSFLAESHGEYPARTTAQLAEFVGTIRSELTMSEFEESERARAELFVDYHEEIAAVQDAFERRWDDFTTNWGTRLAKTLDEATVAADPAIPDAHVGVDFEGGGGGSQRWIFRQGMTDWGGLLKDGWWRSTDDLTPIYERPDDDSLAGVSFYHRLRQNRERAIRDRTLEIELWHAASNSDRFREEFNRNFDDVRDELEHRLPATGELAPISPTTGNLLTIRYDIDVDSYDDFPQAYVGTLNDVVLDIALERPELVALVDEVYARSIEVCREG